MKMSKNLISAIIWTVIALIVFYILFFASTADTIARLSGAVLIGMCLVGQWMRYFKFK